MSAKKIDRKAKRRMTLYSLVAIGLLSSIFFTLPILMQIFDKYQEKIELKKDLEVLKQDEKNLEKEVEQLKDDEYVARIARQKYLFSKDGEIIIKVDKKEAAKTTTNEKTTIELDTYSSYIISGIIMLLIIIFIKKARKKRIKTRHK